MSTETDLLEIVSELKDTVLELADKLEATDAHAQRQANRISKQNGAITELRQRIGQQNAVIARLREHTEHQQQAAAAMSKTQTRAVNQLRQQLTTTAAALHDAHRIYGMQLDGVREHLAAISEALPPTEYHSAITHGGHYANVS